MKPLLTLLLAASLSGCVQSEKVIVGPGGSKETVKSYGLTDRAGGILDAGARYYFRMPPAEEPRRIERSGK